MKMSVYDKNGKKTGNKELDSKIFTNKVNHALLHEIICSILSNKRQGTAKVKTRAEVRGGGRKPWRQKGTGRARAGSIRSPLWKGGGITFGPTGEENYKRKINAKKKKAALKSALSAKAKEDKIIVIKDFKLKEAKTKELQEFLDKLSLEGKLLIVLPGKDEKIMKASRNIPGILTVEARNLNALVVLDYDFILFFNEADKEIKKLVEVKK